MSGRQEEKIREAARSMILRYGTEALRQADQRIRELREHGEEDAVLLWQEIRAAIVAEKGENGLEDGPGKDKD